MSPVTSPTRTRQLPLLPTPRRLGATTEPGKDAGSRAWWTKPRPEDAARRTFAASNDCSDGERLTLERKLDCVWEGLLAAGAVDCPMCGARMDRAGATGRCGGCGTRIE